MIQDDPELVEPIFNELKKNFRTNQTKDISFRKQ